MSTQKELINYLKSLEDRDMHRTGDLLPGIKIKAIITIGVSIMITLQDEDHHTAIKLFKLEDEDFWDEIEFNGETYNIHIDCDEHWAVSLFDSELTAEETWQVDTSREVGIQEAVDGDCFTIIEKCHISGSPVVFEAKEGEGIREYDVCCECDEKTHPDEMVTLPEEDDRMEICSECRSEELGSKERENKDNLVNAVIDQIKEDILQGDTTVLAEILDSHTTSYLKACLPEEGI